MAEETQVLVRFTTKLPPELRVPDAEVAVPASLKRYGLSQVINQLLSLDPPRPFDFLIDGELLRKSLQQHLLDHGISPELAVEVEYVPAVVPPEPKAAIPHDDWVTSVASVGPGSCLASGAADGVVRLWSDAGQCQLEFSAHKGGVNALAGLSSPQRQQHNKQEQLQEALLLSAGKDHMLRLWRVAAAASAGGGGGGGGAKQQQQQQQQQRAQCVVSYRGHREAVQAVAASPAGDLCCSGGWDGQLLLWRTGEAVVGEAAAGGSAPDDAEDAAAAAGSRKKQRVAAANGAAPSAPAQLQPAASLPGHVHCVSAVAWPARGTLYTGGWDHSVRRYDVEARANTDTYHGSKAVWAVAAPAAGGGADVVAFGGSDRALRVWDSRSASGEALAVRAYAAHEGWVSALAWRPGSGHQLASGGHDGAVKLWDIRTAVPLGSLREHGDKVLAVGWCGEGTLVSGGADCKLQLYEVR